MKRKSLFIATGEEMREATKTEARKNQLVKAFLNHLERFHSMSEIFDKDIELEVLQDEIDAINNPKEVKFEKGVVTFSPSSASKCERELFYKAKRFDKDEVQMLPYQKRWVRNGSAIHAAIQKDLLLAQEHLIKPEFKVLRLPNGKPAWERNIKDVKQFNYDGVRFQLFGMTDGILEFKDGTRILFEFKTKSTSLGAIGDYKMKDAQDGHKQQALSYGLLFEEYGATETLFVYESLAKDGWMKGEEAKPDIRVFYYKPTQDEIDDLLEKFARVAASVYKNEIPEAEFPKSEKEFDDGFKCTFCPYKEQCEKDGGYSQAFIDELKTIKQQRRELAAQKRAARNSK